MTKQEFEERIGGTVSDENYSIIEKVYTFHPSISQTDGKDQIAQIYKIGGMVIILDMARTADKMAELDAEMRRAMALKDWIRDRIDYLKDGNWDYEKMLAEIVKISSLEKNDIIENIQHKFPYFDVIYALKMIKLTAIVNSSTIF